MQFGRVCVHSSTCSHLHRLVTSFVASGIELFENLHIFSWNENVVCHFCHLHDATGVATLVVVLSWGLESKLYQFDLNCLSGWLYLSYSVVVLVLLARHSSLTGLL